MNFWRISQNWVMTIIQTNFKSFFFKNRFRYNYMIKGYNENENENGLVYTFTEGKRGVALGTCTLKKKK